MAGHDIEPTLDVRITPNAFTASITTFLALILLCTGLNAIYRLRRSRVILLPTILLLVSALHFVISAGLAYSMKSSIYLSLRLSFNISQPDDDFISTMLTLSKRLQLASASTWAGIYLAKASFVLSFRPQMLASSTSFHRVWFYLALVLVIIAGFASMPLGLTICTDFTPTFFSICPIDTLESNTRVYLFITSTLEVITTILTASIPVTVLAPSPLPLGRKVGLASALTLSVFILVAAILRSALSNLPNSDIDLSWLAFAFGLSAILNIFLATLTALPTFFPPADASEADWENSKPSHSRSRNGSRGIIRPAGTYERSQSREGILKVETEINITEGPRDEGRKEPPTPNVVKVGSDEKKRVSRISEEMWERLVRAEEDRQRFNEGARRVEMFLGEKKGEEREWPGARAQSKAGRDKGRDVRRGVKSGFGRW